MADQYTRITTGGSPLPPTQPVMGLLFGYHEPDRACCVTTDAEDAPLDNVAQATTQIQLHQAVFPQHVVVGWYRVASSHNHDPAAPTEEDLILSLQLQKQYYGTPSISTHPPGSSSGSDGEQQDINESEMPFLFALLLVEADNSNNDNPTKETSESEQELPLQIFTVDVARQVLVGMDDWKLETALAERIAVERVMKEPQPPQQQQDSLSNKDDPTSNNIERQANLLVQATTPMQHSFQALHERWGRVQEYLEATQTAGVSADPALLRQIQGLLLSMGPIAAAAVPPSAATGSHYPSLEGGEEKTADSASVDDLLQQLSLLAKTVTTIQQYTDKVKLVHDTTTTSTSGSVGGGITGLMGGPASSNSASGRFPRGGLASLFSNKL